MIPEELGNAAAARSVPPGERAVRFREAGGTLALTVAPELLPDRVDAWSSRAAEAIRRPPRPWALR